jgi:tetratricopeptide (TPR) repeat protein
VSAAVEDLLATADSQCARGQAAEALATLRRAQDQANGEGTPGLAAQVTVAIAALQLTTGAGGEAMASFRAASDLFGSAGDRPSQVRALIQLALLQGAAGQFEAAKGLVHDCLGTAVEIADDQLTCEARLAGGQLLFDTGDVAAAADEYRAGLALATRLPDASAQVRLRAALAVAVFQDGKAAAALTLLAEDAAIARDMPDEIAGALALSLVSDALVLIKRPLDALAVGRQVLARLQPTGARPLIIQATRGLANLCSLAGQPAEAARLASEATAAAGQLRS